MRWNPRRTQAIRSGGAARKSRGPWNSLEVAKIIVGALTPLLIGCIGIYATWQSHMEDIRRTAREDINSRRSAMIPLVADLMSQDLKYAKSLGKFFSGLPSLDRKLGDAAYADLLKAVKAHDDAFVERDRQVNEDWERIRVVIDDDTLYDTVRGAYEKGVWRPYVLLSHSCIVNLVRDLEDLQPQAEHNVRQCQLGLTVEDPQLQQCSSFVEDRLIDFMAADMPSFMRKEEAACTATAALGARFAAEIASAAER